MHMDLDCSHDDAATLHALAARLGASHSSAHRASPLSELPWDVLVANSRSYAPNEWHVERPLGRRVANPTLFRDLSALRSDLLGVVSNCWAPPLGATSAALVVAGDGGGHGSGSSGKGPHAGCWDYSITLSPRATAVVPVNSSFGGIGLYRMRALLSSSISTRYASSASGISTGIPPDASTGTPTDDSTGSASGAARCVYATSPEEPCEHVAFHTCLRRHGVRIGLLPNLTTTCGRRIHPSNRTAMLVATTLSADNTLLVRRGASILMHAQLPVT